MSYILASHSFILCVLSGQFLSSDNNLIRHTISPSKIQDEIIHFKDSNHLAESRNKWTTKPSELKNGYQTLSKKQRIFYWPELKNKNKSKLIPIQNKFKVKNRESRCFKTLSTSGTTVWDFGGIWSSALAGVRFDMDGRDTVGVDKNVPVKILDRADGMEPEANGFLDKGWMAKASAPFGRRGPFALFAINRHEKAVAVFVGFAHSQNNKEFVSGMWSLGKECGNNLETHQSVFNIPDVLHRDST